MVGQLTKDENIHKFIHIYICVCVCVDVALAVQI